MFHTSLAMLFELNFQINGYQSFDLLLFRSAANGVYTPPIPIEKFHSARGLRQSGLFVPGK